MVYTSIGGEYWKETIKENRVSDEVVDTILDAYLKGIKDGYKKAKSFENQIISKAFQANLEKAMSISTTVAEKIEQSFPSLVKGLFLKIESKSDFKIAIICSMDFYASEKRRDLTKLLIDSELESDDDEFEISFTVIPNKESLNLEKLFLDGYILKNVKYQRR